MLPSTQQTLVFLDPVCDHFDQFLLAQTHLPFWRLVFVGIIFGLRWLAFPPAFAFAFALLFCGVLLARGVACAIFRKMAGISAIKALFWLPLVVLCGGLLNACSFALGSASFAFSLPLVGGNTPNSGLVFGDRVPRGLPFQLMLDNFGCPLHSVEPAGLCLCLPDLLQFLLIGSRALQRLDEALLDLMGGNWGGLGG